MSNELVDSPSNGEIDLREIYKSIIRKKRVFFLTAALLIFLSSLNLVKRRVFSPIYFGSFQLLIKDPINTPDSSGTRDARLSNLIINNNSNKDVNTLIAFLKSPYLLDDISKEFNMSASSLSKKIKIYKEGSGKDQSNGVLNVELRNENFSKSQKILKSLSNVYLKAAVDQKKEKLSEGLSFLDKQYPIILKNTNRIQSKLADFRTENSLLSPKSQSNFIKTNQNKLEEKIAEIEFRINRLEDIKEKISTGKISTRGFADTVGDKTDLTFFNIDATLLNQLITIEGELAEARSKFVEDSYIVKGLQSKLDNLKPLFLETQLKAVDTAISLNQGKLLQANDEKQKLLDQFADQPLLIKEYEDINQELEISRQSLLALASAKERFQIEMAQNSMPWKIISFSGVNPSPVEPIIWRGLIQSIGIGVIFGLIMAWIRDRLDYKFHDQDEVSEDLDFPIIGNIPFVPFISNTRNKEASILKNFIGNKKNELNKDKESLFYKFRLQESVRTIASTLKFLSIDKPLKNLSFSSSIPGEGKSNISLVLSIILSQMGYKILIIDADLRRPQIHQRLGLNNIFGLTNLLSDDKFQIEDAIQKPSKDFENLRVITAGQTVPDFISLLSSEKMKELISKIGKLDFDYIVYDIPPALGISDSRFVLNYLDGFFLIVSLFNVNRNLPKESLKNLSLSGIKPLGILTNIINEKGEKKYNKQLKASGLTNSNDYLKTYSHYIDENDDSLKVSKTNSFEKFLEKYNLDNNKKFSKLVNKIVEWLDS